MESVSISDCEACGWVKPWPLHRVAFRRLCTDCMLKSHLAFFCPFCFVVYEDDSLYPLPHDRAVCRKCPSVAHLSCLPSGSPPHFLCPSCSSPSPPNFSFFSNRHQPFDLRSSRALIAAAKIAAFSMTRAAALARLEADRRVTEATIAKKRAREALETLASFSAPRFKKQQQRIRGPRIDHRPL